MKNYYWTMQNGKKINVDNMDITHLRNVLKMILRNVEAKKTQVSKKKHTFQLHGDMAQDHIDTMMNDEWADEMNYHQGL